MSTMTFITPTFARDYDRFCLQRESMERCGIDIPHLAIVNHEDMAQFAQVPHRKNLQIVSTADVLPPRFEKRRKLWGVRRRTSWHHWLSGRGIHGWGIQQLLKLAAPAVTDAESLICLDSDTFFLDRVTPDDFFSSDGRLHLYETTDDLDAQMAEWHAHALRFLGQTTVGELPRRYTHSPVPWRRDVLIDLHRFIEQKHGKHWMDAIVDADRIMEYTLYGTFARNVDQLRRASPARPDLTLYYWWPDQVKQFAADFVQQGAKGDFKMVLIQSNVGRSVAEYKGLIERAWEMKSAARGPVGVMPL
jgi:hypothetical protein